MTIAYRTTLALALIVLAAILQVCIAREWQNRPEAKLARVKEGMTFKEAEGILGSPSIGTCGSSGTTWIWDLHGRRMLWVRCEGGLIVRKGMTKPNQPCNHLDAAQLVN